MKKITLLLLLMFVGHTIFAQDDDLSEKVNDSIRTEVVNVVTSYAPKVTDAFKIKRKPVISLSKDVEKKVLDYEIINVPVASKFIPKSGALKPIKVGKKERLFDNYVALGFGNNITPYFEGYMHKNNPFQNEYSIYAKYTSSNDPVIDTPLNSGFYDVDVDLYYKQIGSVFNWKVGFIAERDRYNWFGLPTNVDFSDFVVSFIDPAQTYKDYNLYTELEFNDSYIKRSKLSAHYFSDDYNSNEIHGDFNTALSFPLGRFGINSEDFELGVNLNFLGGGFDRTYTDPTTDINYSFLTAGLHPHYNFNVANFDIRLGAKGYFTMDIENNTSEFVIYPDASISYPIIKKHANIYIGASGDLHNNSFKSLSALNPYVSPTLTLLQTNEVYNAFAGFKGIVAEAVNYNIKASYKDEKAKPFYILNEDQSGGDRTTDSTSGFSLRPYLFGNSFDVVYDNVQTLSFIGEVEYDFSKELSLGLNVSFDTFTLENLEEAWHLPQIKGDVYGVYKKEKWYAGTNIYFVGARKGFVHDTTSIVDLDAYVDINVNGGYHFNPIFSAFLKVNNITNSNYETFTNFNSQGFQVVGGIIWKFDALF